MLHSVKNIVDKGDTCSLEDNTTTGKCSQTDYWYDVAEITDIFSSPTIVCNNPDTQHHLKQCYEQDSPITKLKRFSLTHPKPVLPLNKVTPVRDIITTSDNPYLSFFKGSQLEDAFLNYEDRMVQQVHPPFIKNIGTFGWRGNSASNSIGPVYENNKKHAKSYADLKSSDQPNIILIDKQIPLNPLHRDIAWSETNSSTSGSIISLLSDHSKQDYKNFRRVSAPGKIITSTPSITSLLKDAIPVNQSQKSSDSQRPSTHWSSSIDLYQKYDDTNTLNNNVSVSTQYSIQAVSGSLGECDNTLESENNNFQNSNALSCEEAEYYKHQRSIPEGKILSTKNNKDPCVLYPPSTPELDKSILLRTYSLGNEHEVNLLSKKLQVMPQTNSIVTNNEFQFQMKNLELSYMETLSRLYKQLEVQNNVQQQLLQELTEEKTRHRFIEEEEQQKPNCTVTTLLQKKIKDTSDNNKIENVQWRITKKNIELEEKRMEIKAQLEQEREIIEFNQEKQLDELMKVLSPRSRISRAAILKSGFQPRTYIYYRLPEPGTLLNENPPPPKNVEPQIIEEVPIKPKENEVVLQENESSKKIYSNQRRKTKKKIVNPKKMSALLEISVPIKKRQQVIQKTTENVNIPQELSATTCSSLKQAERKHNANYDEQRNTENVKRVGSSTREKTEGAYFTEEVSEIQRTPSDSLQCSRETENLYKDTGLNFIPQNMTSATTYTTNVSETVNLKLKPRRFITDPLKHVPVPDDVSTKKKDSLVNKKLSVSTDTGLASNAMLEELTPNSKEISQNKIRRMKTAIGLGQEESMHKFLEHLYTNIPITHPINSPHLLKPNRKLRSLSLLEKPVSPVFEKKKSLFIDTSISKKNGKQKNKSLTHINKNNLTVREDGGITKPNENNRVIENGYSYHLKQEKTPISSAKNVQLGSQIKSNKKKKLKNKLLSPAVEKQILSGAMEIQTCNVNDSLIKSHTTPVKPEHIHPIDATENILTSALSDNGKKRMIGGIPSSDRTTTGIRNWQTRKDNETDGDISDIEEDSLLKRLDIVIYSNYLKPLKRNNRFCA